MIVGNWPYTMSALQTQFLSFVFLPRQETGLIIIAHRTLKL